ncbi:MAG: hypothetical protein WCH43_05160, partial [Verrucomicrobiota bacterium]
QSPLDAWKAKYFTQAELLNTGTSGDLANPSGDGISNLMKYALNLNPKTNGLAGLPVGAVAATGSGNYMQLTYTRPISAPDLAYIPEVSGDLNNWYSGPGYISTVSVTNNPDGLTQTVVVQDLTSVNSATRRFMRLRVNKVILP